MSTGIEHLQLKWLMAAGACAVLIWFTAIVVADVLVDEGVAVVLTVGAFVLIPVSIGVAVLRYRLFEIDRLIARSVTYVVLAGVLGAVYAGGVLLLTSLMPSQGGLSVAISTLAVAALFNPVRRRLQRAMERRFNRSRYDTQRELEHFSSRLRDELDLDDLVHDVLAVVASTVQPSSAVVWVPRGTPGERP